MRAISQAILFGYPGKNWLVSSGPDKVEFGLV